MNKRFFSILLCFLLLMSIVVPAAAIEEEETPEIRTLSLSTAEAFLEFAEDCRLDSYSQNLEVTLEKDLDLSGYYFRAIPVFCGTFNGNGHTISGVTMDADGSYQGLFRYLTKAAVVKDLQVEGQIHPLGSKSAVGGIAGSNAGTILRCTVVGEISGGDYVGGIAGINTVTGIIDGCRVDGQVYGDHFVGGICGQNTGVIRSCTNGAAINTTVNQNDVTFSDITLETLMNSEAANTTTDIGGIAGNSSGVIRGCANRGDVGYPQIGYNIGGIAGTQSGYIVTSQNYGTIQGRKEVGGIVGQMEPVARIEFSEDTLQILQDQLNTMSGLLNRTTSNVQSAGNQISGQISALQNQTQTAKDAVQSLIPSRENPHLPDVDTILAAQNTLSHTMESMPQTVKGIASSSSNMVSTVISDMTALSNLVSAMCQTMYNSSNNLGGSVLDVSDFDTPDQLTGKVAECTNYGSVLADWNVGGIAGAMALENDLDIAQDWQQTGDLSLNFESEVRAVMVSCQNSGTVTGNKQNTGGLVGLLSLGLVKDSMNTAKVEGSVYIGGVAGKSTGYLRAVSANCEVIGDAYLGGIAGSAMILTDSYAQVKLMNGRERVGAILGWAEENSTETELPIGNNYYLPVEADWGAIDGISYCGIAEPMERTAFLAVANLPDTFQSVKIRFIYEDGTIKEILIPAGEDLTVEKIPEVPVKEGYTGYWKDLDQADLTEIFFDMSFEAKYKAYMSAIASNEIGADGRPVVLLEGSFTDAATVSVKQSDSLPELTKRQNCLQSWCITGNELFAAVHLLYADAEETMQLYVRAGDGQWQLTDFRVDGSYIVFAAEDTDLEVAIVEESPNYLLCGLLAGAALVVLVMVVLISRKRKRRQQPEASNV